MTWVFPGRTVHVDAPCPHCGEPLSVTVRDGALQDAWPEELVCYVDLPFRDWARSWPDT